MGVPETPVVCRTAASNPQTAGRQSAQILAFPTVEKAGTRAEQPPAIGRLVSSPPNDTATPSSLVWIGNVTPRRMKSAPAKLQVRVRDPHRKNPETGQRIRYNLDLGLDITASPKAIAAKVQEIETKIAQGWNPRGAKLNLSEYFYTEVFPHIAKTSRSPKTVLSRFRSLIEPYLGDKKIGEITAADVRRWRDDLLSDGGR